MLTRIGVGPASGEHALSVVRAAHQHERVDMEDGAVGRPHLHVGVGPELAVFIDGALLFSGWPPLRVIVVAEEVAVSFAAVRPGASAAEGAMPARVLGAVSLIHLINKATGRTS